MYNPKMHRMKTQPIIFNYSFGQRAVGSLFNKFYIGMVFEVL